MDIITLDTLAVNSSVSTVLPVFYDRYYHIGHSRCTESSVYHTSCILEWIMDSLVVQSSVPTVLSVFSDGY